ncbi:MULTISPECIES: acylphosphatase [Selenomonas]|uniref:Acylphosphatase n=1 Tax=Selenomonas ruminis TaxID=2593411 RepID=A0A5D6WBQ5_9FIRM|nr:MULTISPECIES: acylphosphatase [unclassified Selenomonas]MBQ1868265.1 acylphosphatase [Selenomonas sp.]TYZ24014.1 acylphosphatase [Selenomonas sp. mPRGC5]
MKTILAWLLAVCWLAASMPIVAAAPAQRVEKVTAVVAAAGSLPPLVQKRMQQSVQAIAGQLIDGQTVAAVSAASQQKEQLIHEVFDKVLVGYTVRQVKIYPAAETKVEVMLLPWSDVITKVDVDVQVEGMPPRMEALVRRDLAGVDTVFRDALTGLPTAATDWTNGVLKHHLNDYLAEHLPEFRGDFEIEPESETKVKLVVYPKLPVVRTVDLSMRSDTVPNVTLLARREVMQEKVDDLVGVPVDFIKRHEQELSQQFSQELDDLPDFRTYHMKTTVSMEAAERLHVMSRSDTSRYRLRLTGWLDIGRKDKNGHEDNESLLFRFHAGTMLSQQDELFLLVDLMPQDMDWGWAAGYDRRLSSRTHAQLRYDLHERRFVLAASQQLAPRWLLRYEYRFFDKNGEAALRYKMHDFLGLEYLVDRHQNWLRVIGNF